MRSKNIRFLLNLFSSLFHRSLVSKETMRIFHELASNIYKKRSNGDTFPPDIKLCINLNSAQLNLFFDRDSFIKACNDLANTIKSIIDIDNIAKLSQDDLDHLTKCAMNQGGSEGLILKLINMLKENPEIVSKLNTYKEYIRNYTFNQIQESFKKITISEEKKDTLIAYLKLYKSDDSLLTHEILENVGAFDIAAIYCLGNKEIGKASEIAEKYFEHTKKLLNKRVQAICLYLLIDIIKMNWNAKAGEEYNPPEFKKYIDHLQEADSILSGEKLPPEGIETPFKSVLYLIGATIYTVEKENTLAQKSISKYKIAQYKGGLNERHEQFIKFYQDFINVNFEKGKKGSLLAKSDEILEKISLDLQSSSNDASSPNNLLSSRTTNPQSSSNFSCAHCNTFFIVAGVVTVGAITWNMVSP